MMPAVAMNVRRQKTRKGKRGRVGPMQRITKADAQAWFKEHEKFQGVITKYTGVKVFTRSKRVAERH